MSPPENKHRKLRMPAIYKTKILILGPCRSGKSTIANLLSDSADHQIGTGDYHPTQGVRIVEFESNDLELNQQMVDAEVELWDCSGDRKFEKCWPAIQKDANAAILVCNPDNLSQIKEIEQWYTVFVLRRGIPLNHVTLFAHTKADENGVLNTANDFRLPPSMADIQVVWTNIDRDEEDLRLTFNNFLCNVVLGLMDRPAAVPPTNEEDD